MPQWPFLVAFLLPLHSASPSLSTLWYNVPNRESSMRVKSSTAPSSLQLSEKSPNSERIRASASLHSRWPVVFQKASWRLCPLWCNGGEYKRLDSTNLFNRSWGPPHCRVKCQKCRRFASWFSPSQSWGVLVSKNDFTTSSWSRVTSLPPDIFFPFYTLCRASECVGLKGPTAI